MFIELDGADKIQAQKELKQILKCRHMVTMIVLGNEYPEIADLARRVAELRDKFRTVVWIKNLELLENEQIKRYKGNIDDTIVCVLNLDKRPCEFLNSRWSRMENELERAFRHGLTMY